VADGRVRNIDEHLQNVFSKDRTPVAIRDAFAQRIVMEHSSASLRHWLAERLANLPAATFSEPDESHLKIWETPEIYREAAPFIQSVADLDFLYATHRRSTVDSFSLPAALFFTKP
jgi:hypothetical protein